MPEFKQCDKLGDVWHQKRHSWQWGCKAGHETNWACTDGGEHCPDYAPTKTHSGYCQKVSGFFRGYCIGTVTEACAPESCGFHQTSQELYDEDPQREEFERRVEAHKKDRNRQ